MEVKFRQLGLLADPHKSGPETQNLFNTFLGYGKTRDDGSRLDRVLKIPKSKAARMSELGIPKIDKWSISGIATAISGKRQEMDSAIACPTPRGLGVV